MEVRIYILFCRRSQEYQGTAEQAFLYKKNAEKRRDEYQKDHQNDQTNFYVEDLTIEDWEQFSREQD